MKTTISIIALLFGLSLSAQTFIQEIDLGKEEEFTEVISLPNKNYIVCGATGNRNVIYPEFPDYRNCDILQLDSNGQIIGSKMIDNFYPVQFMKGFSSFMIYGYYNDFVSARKMAFYELDYQFNILDSLKLSNNSQSYSAQTSKDKNGDIILFQTVIDSVNNIYVSSFLKIDTHLHVLDTTVYDTVSSFAISAISNHRDQFLVYQEAVNYRQMPYKIRNPIFVVDSNGQKLQQVSTVMPVYNSQLDDSLMISRFPHLEELPNKNVVLSGILQNQQSYVPGSSEYIYDYGIIVYDSNMNYLSHQVLGLVDTADFPATTNIAVVDSSFYIVGVSQWYPNDYYKNINNFIRVSQFDFQGNLITSRNYQVGDFVKINSIKPTEDKGLILVGSNYKLFGGTGGLNGFVMKIDSLGNLNTNINEVNGQTIAKDNYKIYPNPAKDKLKLLKLNQFKPYQFELYDAFGRLVKTVSWREDHQTIDVSSLASGMYVYRIIDREGNVGSGKLMVE